MKIPHYNRMTQKEISIQNQNEIKVLSDKMILIENDLKKIDKGVDKILFHLNSDSDTNSEGLIEQTNRIDSQVRTLNELVGHWRFSIWLISGMSLIFGAIGGAISFLIKIK